MKRLSVKQKKLVPGNPIRDKLALQEGLVWVLLTYPDGSEFCFQTTLNAAILRDYGVILEENKLVRLDKQYYLHGSFVYKQFPFVGAKVSLWDSLTYTNEASYSLHEFL